MKPRANGMNSESGTRDEAEVFLRSVRLCYWRVLNNLDAVLKAHRLTARQFLVVQSLGEEGPANVQNLCRRLSVTPAAITQLSNRLEHKRYVRRRRISEDRRQAILGLTPRGAAILRQARGGREVFVRALLHELPPRQRKQMLASLEVLVSALGEDAEHSPRVASRTKPRTPRT